MPRLPHESARLSAPSVPIPRGDDVALIVLVHGAFNELWGPNELHSKWVPALRDGLWHAGVDLDPSDVGICFYGDLFRHDPERDGEPDEQTRAGIADMLEQTLGADAVASLQLAAGKATFDRTVDMVATMMAKPDLRDRVQARVADAVGPDTRIVVAHSLGTIVTYRALCEHPDWGVDTFVTMGSPLGSPMFTEQALERDDDGLGRWPGSVRSWVNIAAVGDRLAAAPRLATVFGDRVVDRRIDNGHRAHDPEPYLNHRVTGEVLASAIAANRAP